MVNEKSTKTKYLDLMERALSAYSLSDIDRYFDSVKETGLTEHGFARLTANIGRLIARGRREDLYDRFLLMMDFCSDHVSKDKAANDFTVFELIECLEKITVSGKVPKGRIALWEENFKKQMIYDKAAKSPEDIRHNWALFAALSEYIRMHDGLCPMDMEYIDIQLATQVRNINEVGMYKDPHCPMVYDLVPRMLFSALLHYGYDGKYKEIIDNSLKNAGLLTLRMQSPTGEIPYGGRSNQFYYNEAVMAAIFEFEAARYMREGNTALAEEFKRGAYEALGVMKSAFYAETLRHIKNRFPRKSGYGCEAYAYFDKYMITAASFLNMAMLFCDESIETPDAREKSPDILTLGSDFHKTFLSAEEYFAEIDMLADPHYDASGLGRIHRRGAPSEICISCPASAETELKFPEDKKADLAISAGIVIDGSPIFKTQGEYKLLSSKADEKTAFASFAAEIDGKGLTFDCLVEDGGVTVRVCGEGEVAISLPMFMFNGENHSEISVGENSASVEYNGYICTYTANGKICDTGALSCNRNGYYKTVYAKAETQVSVKIEINKKQ